MKIKEIIQELIACGRGRTQYILEYLVSLGLKTAILQNSGYLKNIEFCSSDDSAKQEIIFFAHHDISMKTEEGANDNTSSVAVLLKLAGVISKQFLPYNIRLVFTDNEELLGAISPASTSKEVERIISHVGSFMYLKNFQYRQRIRHVIVLELSGIGDAVYVASQSGTVPTDALLNYNLLKIAERHCIQAVELKLPSTDMLSVAAYRLSGTVIGAIPFYQAKSYQNNEKLTPSIWNNIHSEKDNLFAIQEKALEMVCSYLQYVIKEL